MSDKREEWLQRRKRGLGSTDAAPILGLSPWKTAYQVYQEKIGESEGQHDSPAMAYGRLMEQPLRQWYSDQTGREIIVPPSVLVHPKHEIIIGTPDGLTNDKRLLEIKTARSNKDWGEPGTDQIPIYYQTQIQHMMMIVGFVVADVVVSFAGSMPEVYTVESDKELQEMILDEELNFWKLVESRTPPEPVSYADMVARFGKRSAQGSITASPEIIQEVEHLRAIREYIASYQQQEEASKAIIMKFMAENEVLLDANGKPRLTWKLGKGRTSFDSKSFQSEHPEMYSQYIREGEPSRRFLMKGEK